MSLRGALYAALLLLFVLRHDLFLWNDGRLVAGLPVGLIYHVVFCVVVALLMWLLVRFAWPAELDSER